LLKEGLAQPFELPGSHQYVPLLGAVGPLQFDVLKYRLESEYGAECRVELSDWKIARWMIPPGDAADKSVKPEAPSGARLAIDEFGTYTMLLPDQWAVKSLETRNKDWKILATPPAKI
jgi:peptide chain release factor 3